MRNPKNVSQRGSICSHIHGRRNWVKKLHTHITFPLLEYVKSIQVSGMEGLHNTTKRTKIRHQAYNNMFLEPTHTLNFSWSNFQEYSSRRLDKLASVCRCIHTYGQLSYRILQHYKQTDSVFNIWLYPVPTNTNPISGYKERLKKVILGQQP